jgi:hypothetical protein
LQEKAELPRGAVRLRVVVDLREGRRFRRFDRAPPEARDLGVDELRQLGRRRCRRPRHAEKGGHLRHALRSDLLRSRLVVLHDAERDGVRFRHVAVRARLVGRGADLGIGSAERDPEHVAHDVHVLLIGELPDARRRK